MTEEIQRAGYDKVMVIDDSGSDRYIAEQYLKKVFVNTSVISAASALEGLEYLQKHTDFPDELPELIFLDIRMPVMDGFEFLEEYEKLPPHIHQRCKIIMLSSSIDPRDKQRIENNRFVKKFINKPLNREKLQSLLIENVEK